MPLTFWLVIEARWRALVVIRSLFEQLQLQPSALRKGHQVALTALAWSSVIDLAHVPSYLPLDFDLI